MSPWEQTRFGRIWPCSATCASIRKAAGCVENLKSNVEEIEMDSAFATLVAHRLPAQSKILHASCCPDKDLVLLISALHLSLWKIDGTKKWQVDLTSDVDDVLDLAWSPDGQTIAVAYHPPKISYHSVRDGREERAVTPQTRSESTKITGIGWFGTEKPKDQGLIPDIFKRKGLIAGTAHSILRSLPLLDLVYESKAVSTATDLFAFQGSRTSVVPKPKIPDFITSWPSLPADLLSASISPHPLGQSPPDDDAIDEANIESILAVADDEGRLHLFLDGCFPLGAVSLPSGTTVHSVYKHDQKPQFLVTLKRDRGAGTCLWPIQISVPILQDRMIRDFAKLSSTTKELAYFSYRVVQEMDRLYMDNEFPDGGVGIVGKLWLEAIAEKQADNPKYHRDPILDLMSLLVTGRTSEPTAEFLASGPGMSERGIRKWEGVVTEGLRKIRDYAEKCLAPACQRIHLVLEEVYAWSKLQRFALFNLNTERIQDLMSQAGRIIVLCASLAAQVRTEESRFREFIAWILYENTALQPSSDPQRNLPRHDLLDVSDYLNENIVQSPTMGWFTGEKPKFDPYKFSLPPLMPLRDVLDEAAMIANDPSQMLFQVFAAQQDWMHLDRNIEEAVTDLASQCYDLFNQTSGTGVNAAAISGMMEPASNPASANELSPSGLIFRDRLVCGPSEEKITHYSVTHLEVDATAYVSVLRMELSWNVSHLAAHEIVAAKCYVLAGTEEVSLKICKIELFDDENAVTAFQIPSLDPDGAVYVGTFPYQDLGYRMAETDMLSQAPTREQIIQKAVESCRSSQDPVERILIKRYRRLSAVEGGDISLAINGRAGRRTVCVLDKKGTTFESLDMEADHDETMNESIEDGVNGDGAS